MKTKHRIQNFSQMVFFYVPILLFLCIQSTYSHRGKAIEPTIGIAPLWVAAEYGLYWGFTFSGKIKIVQHNVLSMHVDVAPMGLLTITDVDTKGKLQHWGSTLSYLFQMELTNKRLRIEPGIAIGAATTPYIYGTFHLFPVDSAYSKQVTHPKRETVLGIGPQLRISLGKNRMKFFADGRMLFAKNNLATLANVGISFDVGNQFK